MQITDIITEIERALRNTDTSSWVRMTEVAGMTDLTPEQWKAGMREILKSDPTIEVMPESNQKTLTATDRAYRVWCGGMDNDLIMRVA
jgi:hypothetical protein